MRLHGWCPAITCSCVTLVCVYKKNLAIKSNDPGDRMASKCSVLTDTVNRVNALEASSSSITTSPTGLVCMRITGNVDQQRVKDILPGGLDFKVCQAANDWNTRTAFLKELFPNGGWNPITVGDDDACVPIHARPLEDSLLFSPDNALVCTPSVTRSLALANDLRTIRDRTCII